MRFLLVPVAIAASLALAACGGGGSGMSGSTGGAASSNSPRMTADAKPAGNDQVLEGTLPRLNGEPDDLSQYKGKVVLVVNTATECGFTPQFDGLESLYKQKKDEGFVILGFPADDVAHQEPRDNGQIAEFCKANFGVSFPMFEKSNVKDDPINPVFQKLDAELGAPTWNFNKYLLDRQGQPVKHFDVQVTPDSPELVSAIDAQLKS
jgi:glutathione peroxidase